MTERTLPEQLFRLTVEAPERECLRLVGRGSENLALSRGEFFRAAQQAGQLLTEAGALREDLVILIQRDLLLLTASFFGATLIGAIPSIMPFQTEKLHPDRYRNALSALIQIARPSILITEPDLARQVLALLPEGGVGPPPKVLVVRPAELLNTQQPLRLDGTFDAGATALLQHSSGTTGLQKGVALSHRAIFEHNDRYARAIGFSQDDVVVSWLPLYHDMGLIASFLLPILYGARLVLMGPLEWVRAPHMLMQAITRQRGTFCWLPNFAYNFCAQKMRNEDLEGVDLSSIRAFINCSEPIYDSSHRQFAERFAPYGAGIDKLATSYAMAETVFAVTQSQPGLPARVDRVDRQTLHEEGWAQPASDDCLARHAVSSGAPIEGMEVRILDERRHPLPERRVGEIALRTSHMLTGYYCRPEETQRAFYEGWYLTGDMGYLAEGELFVLGRKKDLIIVGGRNIYPGDLETLVNSVEGVHAGRAVAFGIPNPERGTEDIAIVAEAEPNIIEDGRREELVAEIRRAVAGGADVMVRYIELVPRGWLIKTSSGKVSRPANREKFLEAHPEIALPA